MPKNMRAAPALAMLALIGSQPIARSQQVSEAHVVPLTHSTVQTMDKRVDAIRGDRTKVG